MRYLSVGEVLTIYARVMELSGGAVGIRSANALEPAVAQPRMTFSGEDLYCSVVEKAAALGSSIIRNHPFVDGNKRTGHAAMEVFLVLNGLEISAGLDEQFDVILGLASGELDRRALTAWLQGHVRVVGQVIE